MSDGCRPPGGVRLFEPGIACSVNCGCRQPLQPASRRVQCPEAGNRRTKFWPLKSVPFVSFTLHLTWQALPVLMYLLSPLSPMECIVGQFRTFPFPKVLPALVAPPWAHWMLAAATVSRIFLIQLLPLIGFALSQACNPCRSLWQNAA